MNVHIDLIDRRFNTVLSINMWKDKMDALSNLCLLCKEAISSSTSIPKKSNFKLLTASQPYHSWVDYYYLRCGHLSDFEDL